MLTGFGCDVGPFGPGGSRLPLTALKQKKNTHNTNPLITPPKTKTKQMESSVSWAKFGERSIKDYKWNLIQVRSQVSSIHPHICTAGMEEGVVRRTPSGRARAYTQHMHTLALTKHKHNHKNTKHNHRRPSLRRRASISRPWGRFCLPKTRWRGPMND